MFFRLSPHPVKSAAFAGVICGFGLGVEPYPVPTSFNWQHRWEWFVSGQPFTSPLGQIFNLTLFRLRPGLHRTTVISTVPLMSRTPQFQVLWWCEDKLGFCSSWREGACPDCCGLHKSQLCPWAAVTKSFSLSACIHCWRLWRLLATALEGSKNPLLHTKPKYVLACFACLYSPEILAWVSAHSVLSCSTVFF